jgi:hypothetical protein
MLFFNIMVCLTVELAFISWGVRGSMPPNVRKVSYNLAKAPYYMPYRQAAHGWPLGLPGFGEFLLTKVQNSPKNRFRQSLGIL